MFFKKCRKPSNTKTTFPCHELIYKRYLLLTIPRHPYLSQTHIHNQYSTEQINSCVLWLPTAAWNECNLRIELFASGYHKPNPFSFCTGGHAFLLKKTTRLSHWNTAEDPKGRSGRGEREKQTKEAASALSVASWEHDSWPSTWVLYYFLQ